MATVNSKNSIFYKVTSHISVPASVAGTGTFASAAGSIDVVGSGSLFKTEIKRGDWLIDIANDEVRQVENVDTNTTLTLVQGFSNAQTTTAVVSVVQSRAKKIGLIADNAAVTIDGQTMPANIEISWDKSSEDMTSAHSPNSFIDPVIVNATGHNLYVTITE